jgi:SAM-dependent methyltransferase
MTSQSEPTRINASYTAEMAKDGLDVEMRLSRMLASNGSDQEFDVMASHGFRDHTSVLDLGAGPGFYTGELLRRFPSLVVTALEINPAFTARAKDHLDAAQRTQVHFQTAPAEATGLPADTFDIAIARFLLTHVPDPAAVVREMYRILRPGGRAFIIDIDSDVHFAYDPPAPELIAASKQVARMRAQRGGHPYIGRRLARLLRSEHFDDCRLDAIVLESDVVGLHAMRSQFDQRLARISQLGYIETEAAARLVAATERFFEAPDANLVVMRYLGTGTKPAR